MDILRHLTTLRHLLNGQQSYVSRRDGPTPTCRSLAGLAEDAAWPVVCYP